MSYIIKWKNKETGEEGQVNPREYIKIIDVINLWVDELNRRYPDIQHWVEAAPDTYTPGNPAYSSPGTARR